MDTVKHYRHEVNQRNERKYDPTTHKAKGGYTQKNYASYSCSTEKNMLAIVLIYQGTGIKPPKEHDDSYNRNHHSVFEFAIRQANDMPGNRQHRHSLCKSADGIGTKKKY